MKHPARLLTASLVAVPVFASAAFLQYTSTITPQVGDFTTSFTVQKFDPAFGSLTGVSLWLAAEATAELLVLNATSSPQSFTDASASIPLVVDVTAPDGLHLTITAVSAVVSGVAQPGLNSYPGVTATASTGSMLTPSHWSPYVGPGNGPAVFTADFDTGSYAGEAPFLVFFSGQAEAGGAFAVRYDYEPVAAPVPLPGSASMFVLGMSAVGLWLQLRHRLRRSLRGAASPGREPVPA